MTFPSWTVEYFRWQFRLDCDVSRDGLIAAYDGNVLVGVLLGTAYPFRLPGVRPAERVSGGRDSRVDRTASIGQETQLDEPNHRSVLATNLADNGKPEAYPTTSHPDDGIQWSWLSIHPDYRGRGIVKALHQERIARQTAAKSRLIVSFRYVGSRHSRAERPEKQSLHAKFNRKVGFWARVLNADRFAKWHWSRVEGFLARMTSPLTGIPASARTDASVRPFKPDDLNACVDLASSAFESFPLTIAWDRSSLKHQLSGNEIAQTLVLEEDARVTAFVNFHLLRFQAKTIENVAILDLIVLNKASSKGRVRLLNAALAQMQTQGAILALKVRCGDTLWWPLLKTHFVPQLPDSYLVLQSVSDQINVPKSCPIHVLWR